MEKRITSVQWSAKGIGSHSEFTQIFPEYTFDDIAFPYGAHTLVVTIKD